MDSTQLKFSAEMVSRETNYSLENEERRIVQIEKISQTPTKYPRNSSQIKKKLL